MLLVKKPTRQRTGTGTIVCNRRERQDASRSSGGWIVWQRNELVLTWADARRAAGSLPASEQPLFREILGDESCTESTPAVAAAIDEQWFLARVDVQGHVGIGEATVSLDLTPVPGVTVISAPNGTGKTSIVHGVRRCLGSDPRRDEVLEGNLHHEQRNIAVTITDGPRVVCLRSSGASPTEWHEAEAVGMIPERWSQAYSRFQPVLLYPEIAEIITEPGNLHEFLKGAISVEVLQELQRRIDAQRSASRKATANLKELRNAAADLVVDDGYATIRAALAGCAELPTAGERLALAEAIADLSAQTSRAIPEIVEIGDVPEFETTTSNLVESLNEAKSGVLEGSEILRDILRKLGENVDVLNDARTADRCPVCAAIGQDWHKVAREQEVILSRLLAAYDTAKEALDARLSAIVGVLPKTPEALKTLAALVDFAEEAKALKSHWDLVLASAAGVTINDVTVASIDALVGGINGLRAERDALAKKLDALRTAQTGHGARIASAIRAWLDNVDAAKNEISRREPADKLKNWVDGQIKQTRDLLFQPIAEGAKEIWTQLNPESDLGLTSLDIGGGTQRQQKILPGLEIGGVTVPSSAEGVRVLSTGQRNALSLATYLPRSAQLASPFRFLVLDDPIQAFDGSRVNYLAVRLAEIAKRNQVVVFTHDERLWNELCAMSANARRVVLRRRADGKSQVEVIEATSAGDVLLGELSRTLAVYESGNDSGATEEAVTALSLAVCRQALDAELVQQLGILGRRSGRALDQISADIDTSSQTRDRLRVWSTYCSDCGLGEPDWSAYNVTVSALNQASHGQTPEGVTQDERRQWIADSSDLIRLVADASLRIPT